MPKSKSRKRKPPEARTGAPGPRTRQDGRAEQPDVRQRPTDLRPRDSRVRRLVLLGAPARVQPHDPATRGALGDCRSGGQGRTCANCPDAHVGEERRRRVDGSGGHHPRSGVPSSQQGRACAERRHVAQGAPGCCSGRGGSRRDRQAGPARPAAHLRTSLPPGGRRTGSNPFLLGHVSIHTTERYLGCKQKLGVAVNDGWESNRMPLDPDSSPGTDDCSPPWATFGQ